MVEFRATNESVKVVFSVSKSTILKDCCVLKTDKSSTVFLKLAALFKDSIKSISNCVFVEFTVSKLLVRITLEDSKLLTEFVRVVTVEFKLTIDSDCSATTV